MFYIPQIIILLFAVFSGPEEGNFTWAYRRVIGNAPQGKLHLKRAHTFGAWGVGVICGGLASYGAIFQMLFNELSKLQALGLFGVLMLLLLFIYWLTFDIVYAKSIKQKWYYLGATAQMDIRLRKFKIKNVGIWKATFCILSIVVLNLIAKLFC